MLTTVSRNHVRDTVVEPTVYTAVDGNVAVPNDVSRDTVIPFFEDYYERYTPNSAGNRNQWKAFEHYKCAVVNSPVMVSSKLLTSRYDSGSGWPNYHSAVVSDPYYGYAGVNINSVAHFGVGAHYGGPGKLNLGLPVFIADRLDGGFVPPPASLDELTQNALQRMLPLIKSELSLLNSLYEIKDWHTIGTSLREARRLLNKQGFTRAGRNVSLMEGLHSTADGYLQAKFNVLPLLSDIAGIQTGLSTFMKRINDFVTRSGRVQSKHFAWRWYEYPDSLETTDPFFLDSNTGFYPGSEGSCRYSRQVIYQPTVFHAQIEYNYNYTQYQILHAGLLALLDAWGVNLNPQIIWMAIPWSFVVDWVFGVSRWLGQFKVQNMKPTINIRRFLWSVKRHRRIFVSKELGYDLSGPLAPYRNLESPLPVVDESAYRRFVGMPSSSSITSSGLSSSEFSLGAALVITQRRPHKRF